MALTIRSTRLTRTEEQVRDIQLAHVGTKGRPNPWDSQGMSDSDCLEFQTWSLGLRTRTDRTLELINIHAFVANTAWPRIEVDALRPGDLVFQNWTLNGNHYGQDPEHVGRLYSPILADDLVWTTEANTGPAAGVAEPNGMYKKSRPLGGWLLFGIRPPYADPATTVKPSTVTRTRLIATYLNRHLPEGGKVSDAGAHGKIVGDGIAGPVYWRNVQLWGRATGIYGTAYRIDGIPGPRTRYVEGQIELRAKATP